MARGKLYSADENFISDIDYQFHEDSPNNWWGELILIEFKRIGDGGRFIIELEDRRRAICHLKKRVNRATSGIPPRYIYYFNGNSPLV